MEPRQCERRFGLFLAPVHGTAGTGSIFPCFQTWALWYMEQQGVAQSRGSTEQGRGAMLRQEACRAQEEMAPDTAVNRS